MKAQPQFLPCIWRGGKDFFPKPKLKIRKALRYMAMRYTPREIIPISVTLMTYIPASDLRILLRVGRASIATRRLVATQLYSGSWVQLGQARLNKVVPDSEAGQMCIQTSFPLGR